MINVLSVDAKNVFISRAREMERETKGRGVNGNNGFEFWSFDDILAVWKYLIHNWKIHDDSRALLEIFITSCSLGISKL